MGRSGGVRGGLRCGLPTGRGGVGGFEPDTVLRASVREVRELRGTVGVFLLLICTREKHTVARLGTAGSVLSPGITLHRSTVNRDALTRSARPPALGRSTVLRSALGRSTVLRATGVLVALRTGGTAVPLTRVLPALPHHVAALHAVEHLAGLTRDLRGGEDLVAARHDPAGRGEVPLAAGHGVRDGGHEHPERATEDHGEQQGRSHVGPAQQGHQKAEERAEDQTVERTLQGDLGVGEPTGDLLHGLEVAADDRDHGHGEVFVRHVVNGFLRQGVGPVTAHHLTAGHFRGDGQLGGASFRVAHVIHCPVVTHEPAGKTLDHRSG